MLCGWAALDQDHVTVPPGAITTLAGLHVLRLVPRMLADSGFVETGVGVSVGGDGEGVLVGATEVGVGVAGAAVGVGVGVLAWACVCVAVGVATAGEADGLGVRGAGETLADARGLGELSALGEAPACCVLSGVASPPPPPPQANNRALSPASAINATSVLVFTSPLPSSRDNHAADPTE
jgi:hypothetical protein